MKDERMVLKSADLTVGLSDKMMAVKKAEKMAVEMAHSSVYWKVVWTVLKKADSMV